jgi:hypothetical protein
MKRAMKGDFDLFGEAGKVYESISQLTDGKTGNESYGDEKLRYASNFKKVVLLMIHAASKKFDKKLVHEQEVLNSISDIMMETYVAESLALRIIKLESMRGVDQVYRDIVDTYLFNAASKVRKSAVDAIYSTLDGSDAETLAEAIEKLTKVAGVNLRDASRRIADKLIGENAYKF